MLFLQTLHSLLEEDTARTFDNKPSPDKVGFVGISNWALDPAKMNRGVLVHRGTPDKDELVTTAR